MHFAKLFPYGDEQLLVTIQTVPAMCLCGKCPGVEMTTFISAMTHIGRDQCQLLLDMQRGDNANAQKLLAAFNQLDADHALQLIQWGHHKALTNEEYQERTRIFLDSLRMRAGVPIKA